MSVSGIFSSNQVAQQYQPQYQLTGSQFQQLGQDLATGNLSSAQSDFAALQQVFAQATSSGSSTGSSSTSGASSTNSTTNPLAQDFQQLSSDLQSGNLAGAQKDYSTIQQQMQNQFSGHMHHHGHHGGGGGEMLNLLNQNSQSTSSTTQGSTTSDVNAATQQMSALLAQQLQQYGGTMNTPSVNAILNPVEYMA